MTPVGPPLNKAQQLPSHSAFQRRPQKALKPVCRRRRSLGITREGLYKKMVRSTV